MGLSHATTQPNMGQVQIGIGLSRTEMISFLFIFFIFPLNLNFEVNCERDKYQSSTQNKFLPIWLMECLHAIFGWWTVRN